MRSAAAALGPSRYKALVHINDCRVTLFGDRHNPMTVTGTSGSLNNNQLPSLGYRFAVDSLVENSDLCNTLSCRLARIYIQHLRPTRRLHCLARIVWRPSLLVYRCSASVACLPCQVGRLEPLPGYYRLPFLQMCAPSAIPPHPSRLLPRPPIFSLGLWFFGQHLRHGGDKFIENGITFEYTDTFDGIAETPSFDVDEYEWRCFAGNTKLTINLFNGLCRGNVFRTQLYRT